MDVIILEIKIVDLFLHQQVNVIIIKAVEMIMLQYR